MIEKIQLQGFVPRRRGGGLFWLGLLLLAAAAADQFYFQLLGSLTLVAWGVGGLLFFIAILLRLLPLSSSQSAFLQIEEDGIIISYAGHQLPVTFENIDVVTGGRISQHYSLKAFSRRERQVVKPYFNQTQIFIALHEETEELQAAKQAMPRYMFGTTRVGLLLLAAEDWITVERAIDAARVAWLGQVKSSHQEVYRSPAAMLWDNDEDEEEEDEWLS